MKRCDFFKSRIFIVGIESKTREGYSIIYYHPEDQLY